MFKSHPHPRRRKPPSALFLPPPILHERYLLDPTSIGVGGSARVYRAWDAIQGKHVALKRARLSHRHSDMLSAEAETLSGLHHPSIPAFIEYFEEEGRAYLAEAWMEGMVMKQLCHFEIEHVLWIGRHLCEVLDYLHRQHLVHRDIAPGNILLNMEKQRLALLDFGLARPEPCATQDHDDSGVIERTAGTPGYVAPEQWNEGKVSPACDIYSLGMVLLGALTGCQHQEIVAVRSSLDLWETPATIPVEEVPLLVLFDRMIASDAAVRPHLTEVHFQICHLQRCLFGTD